MYKLFNTFYFRFYIPIIFFFFWLKILSVLTHTHGERGKDHKEIGVYLKKPNSWIHSTNLERGEKIIKKLINIQKGLTLGYITQTWREGKRSYRNWCISKKD